MDLLLQRERPKVGARVQRLHDAAGRCERSAGADAAGHGAAEGTGGPRAREEDPGDNRGKAELGTSPAKGWQKKLSTVLLLLRVEAMHLKPV